MARHWIGFLSFVIVAIRGCLTCNFGPGCKFDCHCRDDVSCDQLTGACPPGYGCKGGWSGLGCLTQNNIALGKQASQDTRYDPYTEYTADKAVDGDRSTYYTDCARVQTHNTRGAAVWWRVDFNDLYRVTGVYLFTLFTEDENKLSAYVTNSTNTRDLSSHEVCLSNKTISLDSQGVYSFQCSMVGRSLIFYQYDDILTICEVEVLGHLFVDCTNCGSSYEDETSCNQVYGCVDTCAKGKDQDTFCLNDCPEGRFGRNCRHDCTNNRCLGGDMCESVEGFCPRGCEMWYVGERCKKYVARSELADAAVTASEISDRSAFIHWSPRPVTDPDLRQYYGYAVYVVKVNGPQDESLGKTLYDSEETQHSSLTLVNLTYNTQYTVRVQPFRRDVSKDREELGTASDTLPIKTTCIAPQVTIIHDYVQLLKWNGSMETGEVQFSPIEFFGCDSITRLTVTWSRAGDITPHSTDIPIMANHTGVTFHRTGRYDIRIEAVNNEGYTSISAPKAVDITPKPGSNPDSPDENSGGMVIGIAVGCTLGLLAIAGVLLAVYFFRRRRGRSSNKAVRMSQIGGGAAPDVVPRPAKKNPALSVLVTPPAPNRASLDNKDESRSLLSLETIDDPDDPENIYENRILVARNIRLEALRDTIYRMTSDAKAFEEEFNALPKGHMAMCDVGKLEENLWKNRFKNVLSYDHTRVVLTKCPGGDYINGNYIQGYGKRDRRYIATQGPKPKTVADFWHVVWQERVTVVVMLTPVMENTKKQSEQYWPSMPHGRDVHGGYTVTIETELITAYYTQRTLRIKSDKTAEPRTVQHFQYLAWPDKNRPLHAHSALDLIRRVRAVQNAPGVHRAPTLVHCSAGIGRTGTYIALDYLIEQADTEGQIDIHSCVHLLRTQRVSLVQTLSQYIFLYDAMLEYYSRGTTAVPINSLHTEHGDIHLSTTLPLTMQEERQNLLNLQTLYDTTHADGRNPENTAKNRDSNIIPADRFRPFLNSRSSTGNSYINAVLVDTFRARDDCVVTQIPLPNTTDDFWRLVHDQNCSLIVLLDDFNKLDGKTCTEFWPSQGQSNTFGNIRVETLTEEQTKHHAYRRMFSVTPLQGRPGNPHHVTMLQCCCWSDKPEGRPENCGDIIGFIEMVNNIQKKDSFQRKTIVQSLDGASKAGVYCAAKHVLDRMQTFSEIDVSLATYAIAERRPQFVQTKEEYLMVYKLAATYSERFGTYANL